MNIDYILTALNGASPLCDDCLSERSGVTPRQAVNYLCRMHSPPIHREKGKNPCRDCDKYKIVNKLA